MSDSFSLNKGQTDKLKNSVNTAVEDVINEKSLTLSNQVRELETKFESKKQEAEMTKDENALKVATKQYEEEKLKLETSFSGN